MRKLAKYLADIATGPFKAVVLVLIGVSVGLALDDINKTNSDVERAKQIALAICAQMPSCVTRARNASPDFADIGYLITQR